MFTIADLENVITYIVDHDLSACENENSSDYLHLVLQKCIIRESDSFTEKVFKSAVKNQNFLELSTVFHCDVNRINRIIFYQQIDDKIITGLAKLQYANHMHDCEAKVFLEHTAKWFLYNQNQPLSIKKLLSVYEQQSGDKLCGPSYLSRNNIVFDFDWKTE